MPQLDLIDDTYVAAPPDILAPLVSAPALAAELWPGWNATVTEERGAEGVRWAVAGPVTGSTEVWIERFVPHGSVLHVYIRADPSGPPWSARRAARETERARRRVKAVMWRLKDHVEGYS